jgi:phage shock protein A
MEKHPADPGDPANLSGMDTAGAKEYILGFIATLKLTEKQAQDLDGELLKWNSRIELSRTGGRSDLAAEAEAEVTRIKSRRERLAAEIDGLQSHIAEMRRQLPLLAARERSVDPDLLEQELIMAAGYLPGERTGPAFDKLVKLEQEAAADAALAELKAKMEGKERSE